MTHFNPLTSEEEAELAILNLDIQEAINTRTRWLQKKTEEKARYAIDEWLYDVVSGYPVYVVKGYTRSPFNYLGSTVYFAPKLQVVHLQMHLITKKWIEIGLIHPLDNEEDFVSMLELEKKRKDKANALELLRELRGQP